ncbi:MAG: extracellular solute-binding protein [Pseudomonadota bacterium]
MTVAVLQGAVLGLLLTAGVSAAQDERSKANEPGSSHAIAMHGSPELPAGFNAFPYARADAPKGGRIVFGEHGSFDGLNPYILRGRAPFAVRDYVVESLMARSWDEPFSLYGLLAERIDTPEDRRWVEYHLNPAATFSDGSPVRPEDVLWTIRTLIESGKPNYAAYFRDVVDMRVSGPQSVRFEFSAPNRELPLMIGLMPVLSEKSFRGRTFGETPLVPLVGSGPYVVEQVAPGRSMTLRRNPDYWGADLPASRGRYNLDVIEYQYFRDHTALWEAFKAGQVSVYRAADPARWEEAKTLPAARAGHIQRSEIGHERASGMRGFVFNTRRPQFADRRVREALSLAFDFRWLNSRLFSDNFQRIESYFGGSDLAHRGAATGREYDLLKPYVDTLPAGALTAGWRPSMGQGDGRNRANLRQARQMLVDAGWRYSRGALRNAEGKRFAFDILLTSYADERVAGIFVEALKPLGISATVRVIDDAQYRELMTVYDFDMTVGQWWLSLSPGDEQRLYWGGMGVETPGTRNYMGADHPAIEAMIEAMLRAKTRQEFTAAVRALDRVLSSGIYVIPFWREKADRYLWWDHVDRPEATPLYGYRADVWWSTSLGARRAATESTGDDL